MLSSAIGRFRVIAMLEGASFVVLLFIAMPLKYLAGMPLAVRVVGMAHGVLFIAFVLAFVLAQRSARWDLSRSLTLFGGSLIPFGPFFFDRALASEQEAEAGVRAE